MSTITRIRKTALYGAVRTTLGVRGTMGDLGAQLLGKDARADPYPLYRRIRDRGRLVPSSIGWLTATHEVCDAVLRDHERFGSAEVATDTRDAGWLDHLVGAAVSEAFVAGAGGEAPNPLGPESMIGMNPPDHTRLRRSVGRAFTPRAIARLRPRVEQVTADLLDTALTRGRLDVVTDLAGTLPVVVICELLGVPTESRAQIKRWGEDVALLLDIVGPAEQVRAATAVTELAGYFTELFAQRRAAPGDAVIDRLLAEEGAEEPIPERELMATALLLLVAGFETTVNLIGNGVLALLEHPDQEAVLRADRSLLPNAVDEMLRWDPPVQQDGRFVRRPVRFEGHDLPVGSQVLPLLAGANRDPAVFRHPERFDVTRDDADRHLSFASGVHYCLGAALARMEAEVALAALLDRVPRLRQAGPARRRPSTTLRGLTSLPLDPGGAR